MKKVLSLILMTFIVTPAFAGTFDYGYTSTGFKYVKHKHSEASYQRAWCSMHQGIEEFENKDKTQVKSRNKKPLPILAAVA